jgi:formylglycine-generating enzyme required for sulfatase activity
MHGNVWERCEDDWHDNYQGVAWRLLGQISIPFRSASRGNYNDIGDIFGFRVVCEPPMILLSI